MQRNLFFAWRMIIFALQFHYTVESNQLTFLQLHSDKAKQKITYHCVNSTAWRDRTDDSTHSIKLLGDNEREYKATTPRKHRPIVFSDGCKVGLVAVLRYSWSHGGYKTTKRVFSIFCHFIDNIVYRHEYEQIFLYYSFN